MIKRHYFYRAQKRGSCTSIESWSSGLISIRSWLPKDPGIILKDIKTEVSSNGLNGSVVEITAFNKV